VDHVRERGTQDSSFADQVAAMAARLTQSAPGYTDIASAVKQSQEHSYNMHATSTAATVKIATAAFKTMSTFSGNGQHRATTAIKGPNEWSYTEAVGHLVERLPVVRQLLSG
jgi:hypothetical protein